MAQGIIITDNRWMADLLALNLEIYVGVKTITLLSVHEVEQHSPILQSTDIIYIDHKFEDGVALEVLRKLIKEMDLEIPCLIFNAVPEKLPKGKNYIGLKSISIPPIMKFTAKKLDITARDMISMPTANYIGLDLKYIVGLKNIPCVIYKRYTLDSDDFAYEKISDKGSDVSEDDVKNMVKKDVKKFYIQSSFRLKFVNFYTTSVLQSMRSSIKKEKFIEMMRDSISSTLVDGRAFEEVREMADMCISESIETVEGQKDSSLDDFLKRLRENTDSYYVQSAQIIAYAAFKILRKLNWMKMSQKNSIVAAGFFSNILFEDNEEHLAKIRFESEIKDLMDAGKITSSEQNKVTHHAANAAQILSNADAEFFAETALNVLREHHGNKKGIGFSHDSESSLHSLSIIYNLAQDYCDMVLLQDISNHDIIVQRLKLKYEKEGRKKSLNYLKHLEVSEKPLKISI